MTQTSPIDRNALMNAILAHVAFDGWSETAFHAAVKDLGIDMAHAKLLAPRGAVDLALDYHRSGDEAMRQSLSASPLPDRIREKITFAVKCRIELIDDKEAVRRAMSMFALPLYAGDGVKALWGTADAIWDAIGDNADDLNWYTKRMSLSAVYSATLLFWLGDDSVDHQASWAFLDRRIDEVMRFEKAKAGLKQNKLLSAFCAVPNAVLSNIKAPKKKMAEFPGHWQNRDMMP